MAKKPIPTGNLKQKEALAELKELSKEIEFTEKFDETTPVATLRKLVAKGRKALAEANTKLAGEGDADDAEDSEEADKVDEAEDTDADAADTDNAEDADDAEADDESEDAEDDVDEDSSDDDVDMEDTAPQGKGAHVYDKNERYVRSYTAKQHGKNYVELAKQFVAKKGREGYFVKMK